MCPGIADGDQVNASASNAAWMYRNIVEMALTTDSTSTGSNQDVTLTNQYTRFTNTSLVSIRNLSYSNRSASSILILRNSNNASLTFVNDSGGTAANRIITGLSANLVIPHDGVAVFIYDTATSRWYFIAKNSAENMQNQIFTSNGTFTFPAGTSPSTKFKFTIVGAGAGGGGASGSANQPGGNGGGAGATAIKWLSGVTAAKTVAVTVGSTGSGGTTGNNGSAGNNSTIASGTETITTVTAGGGGGGAASGTNQSRAAGGTATNGDLNFSGGDGYLADVNAGATSCGGNGGCSSLGGGGSGGGAGGNNQGSNSPVYGAGGGGGGGQSVSGGNGKDGIVIVEWVL